MEKDVINNRLRIAESFRVIQSFLLELSILLCHYPLDSKKRIFKITYLGTRPAYITWCSPLRDSLKQNGVMSDLEVGKNFKLLSHDLRIFFIWLDHFFIRIKEIEGQVCFIGLRTQIQV